MRAQARIQRSSPPTDLDLDQHRFPGASYNFSPEAIPTGENNVIAIRTIFAVIDPTTDQQLALKRAVRIAGVTQAEILAYACIHSTLETESPDTLKRVETARYEPWLDGMIGRARANGVKISKRIDWDPDWRGALGPAAAVAGADLIVKSSHRRSAARRLMVTSSDVRLFATANCPVLLVTSEAVDDPQRVLIAIDPRRTDKSYERICAAVVEYGKAAAASLKGGELHVVYAYPDPHDYLHVTDVASRAGVEVSRAHVSGGKPEDVIARVAREIDAGLTVIGLSTKGSVAGRAFGYTAEALVNRLNHDILVVIPEPEPPAPLSREATDASRVFPLPY